MAATNELAITNKIDNGLAGYYSKNHRWDYANEMGIGKFKEFVEISGFEEDDVVEELAGEAEDCTLTEFDLDDDGNNQFPFEEPIDDEEQKTAEIFRLLNEFAKVGGTDYNIAIHVANFLGITEEQMKRTVEKHVSSMMTPFQESTDEQSLSMKILIDKFSKNKDLLYFLSVAENTQYPFLTYMVDSYTRANARHYSQKKETLGISSWVRKLSLYQKLKQKDVNVADMLISAMHSYSSRIMPRINFNPIVKIKDSLKEICQLISAIPNVINKITKLDAATPFQFDLTIAVRQVGLAVADEKSDNDDDDDDYSGHDYEENNYGADEKSDNDDDDDDYSGHDYEENNYGADEKQLDPETDHVGDVKRKLHDYPASHVKLKVKEKVKIARKLGSGWDDFRDKLEKSNKAIINNSGMKNYYNMKKFPQNRRFGIFVDRRQSDKESDEVPVTLFAYPDDCNAIKRDHVAELGFDLLRRCIIPDRDRKKYINSVTNVCGQLITFMFCVEQQNEIRCYLVWNGKTMRFHAEHMSQVLPSLFEESEENIEFIEENEELNRLEKMYRDEMKDEIYENFCKSLDFTKN